KTREAIKTTEDRLAKARKARNDKSAELAREVAEVLPRKAKSEARAQSIKADYDSKVSIYNIAVEKRDSSTAGPSVRENLKGRAEDLAKEVQSLADELAKAQAEVDANNLKLAEIKSHQKADDDKVAAAEDELKQKTADFERFAKLAVQKRWKAGDTFRKLPVIDAFASPTRIQQFTLNDLPIDYNFKQVTRFD